MPRLFSASPDGVGTADSPGRSFRDQSSDYISSRRAADVPSPVDDQDLALAIGSVVPILIAAETQDERDALAREIHRHGCRRTGPFVSVLSDAVAAAPAADHALEASGPVEAWIAMAVGGTLFVGEIGRLTTEHQAQLLRALDHHVDVRQGVRLIVGAGRKWGSVDRAGQGFCERLYYRLNTLRIECRHAEKTPSGNQCAVLST